MRGPNCTKLAEDTEGSLLSYEIVSDFKYLAAFSNADRSNSSYVENDAKFSTCGPPVKIRGGVGEISGSIIVPSPRTANLA